jgi:hypothetical protein
VAERKPAGRRGAKARARDRGAAAGGGSSVAAETGVSGTRSAEHTVCSVALCPICTVVTALGEASPELVEHLLVAGRELLLAVRAVIDGRLQTMEEEPRAGLQRIEID